MKMNKNQPLFVFYLLVGYVCLQFAWWAFMLFSLNNELAQKKMELLKLQSGNESVQLAELDEKLYKRWAMIAGEGTVFLILLTLGIVKTHRTFKKEMELSQLQKNFLLSITHELKSPLASNKLQLQTMLKHELPPEKQKVLLNAALHDTERLISLTDNLLLAAKIESKDFAIYTEEQDLAELVEKSFASTPKEHLKLDLQKGIKLNVDNLAFPSIVLNLYENARKYSGKESPVSLSLRKDSGRIIIACADEGPGIPDHEKPHVFKKFYRIGSEETRKTKGTGLGLYIVKKLVEKHQGQIFIKDNKPKGCIFEIQFNQHIEES
jgi:K+-sensing histidine kinase KdpD